MLRFDMHVDRGVQSLGNWTPANVEDLIFLGGSVIERKLEREEIAIVSDLV